MQQKIRASTAYVQDRALMSPVGPISDMPIAPADVCLARKKRLTIATRL